MIKKLKNRGRVEKRGEKTQKSVSIISRKKPKVLVIAPKEKNLLLGVSRKQQIKKAAKRDQNNIQKLAMV